MLHLGAGLWRGGVPVLPSIPNVYFLLLLFLGARLFSAFYCKPLHPLLEVDKA